VLLKGATALLPGPHAMPNRMVGDIDLLIPTDREADALAALGAAGFRLAGGYPAVSHSIADLERPGGPGWLDLHRALLDPPFQHLLPAAAVIGRAERLDAAGLGGRVPSPRDHALHVLLHAQILGAGYYDRRLDLGAARDLAWLGGRLDWAEIEAWAGRHRMRPMLDSMLLAARDVFGLAWPLSTSPDRVAVVHHQRACRVEATAGQWYTGLGLLATLRESFAPDRLAAAFGTQHGFLSNSLRQIGRVTRRSSLRDMVRRLLA
jgi:Uncharacterised nucleotidyltransferase